VKKKDLAKRLAAALEEVGAAAGDLARLLREIKVAPRASKTTISETVRDALARLRVARTNLLALQKLTVSDDR